MSHTGKRHRRDYSLSPSPKRSKYDHNSSREYSSKYDRSRDYDYEDRRYVDRRDRDEYKKTDSYRDYSPRKDSSNSENTHKHKKESKKEKKERKKERKERKKEKKARKEEKKRLKKQSKEEIPIGKPPKFLLSVEENYYSHNKEFRFWLNQTNRSTWDELSNTEARELFSEFVEKWNEGGLSERYYTGNLNNSSTSHSWVKSTSGESKSSKSNSNLFDRGQTSSHGTRSHKDQFEKEQDFERLRYERKKFRKTNEFVEEELVPKPVGREAMIEKKKQRSAYSRMEKDTDYNYSDNFLMGDSNSEYQQMLQRSRARNEAKAEKLQQEQEKRKTLADKYKAKEDAILESFRSVVDKGDIPLLKYQPKQ